MHLLDSWDASRAPSLSRLQRRFSLPWPSEAPAIDDMLPGGTPVELSAQLAAENPLVMLLLVLGAGVTVGPTVTTRLQPALLAVRYVGPSLAQAAQRAAQLAPFVLLLTPAQLLTSFASVVAAIAFLSLNLQSFLTVLGPASLAFVVALDAYTRPLVRRTGRGWKSRGGPELHVRLAHFARLFVLWLGVMSALAASLGISHAFAVYVAAPAEGATTTFVPGGGAAGGGGGGEWRTAHAAGGGDDRWAAGAGNDHRAAGGETWHASEEEAAPKKGSEGSTTAERRRRVAPHAAREPSHTVAPCTQGRPNVAGTCRCGEADISINAVNGTVVCGVVKSCFFGPPPSVISPASQRYHRPVISWAAPR